MSFKTNFETFISDVATDWKNLRTILFGSVNGSLASLTTNDKTSVVAAINEVKASATGAPPAATESAAGIVELATLSEVAAGVDTSRAVTAAGVRQERTALKAEILGGVGPAFDTLQELLDVANAAEETAAIDALVTQVGLKANAADVYTKTEIDNMLGSDLANFDAAAYYAAAKA